LAGDDASARRFSCFELVRQRKRLFCVLLKLIPEARLKTKRGLRHSFWRKPLGQPSSRLTSLERKARCSNATDPGSTRLSFDNAPHLRMGGSPSFYHPASMTAVGRRSCRIHSVNLTTSTVNK
jgi:hypothetical protein